VQPADDDAEFRTHAGTVLWPSSPDALTDTTKCPACFTPLRDIVCSNCGLNLAHPAAAELATVSTAAAERLSRRVAVIGRIRYETSRRPLVVDATDTAVTTVEPATVHSEVGATPDWELPVAVEPQQAAQPSPPTPATVGAPPVTDAV